MLKERSKSALINSAAKTQNNKEYIEHLNKYKISSNIKETRKELKYILKSMP